MGLFRNNRKTYITNMDNMLVYNREKKEYVLDFNEDQKKILNEFIEWNYPLECIAYTEVPSEVMRAARDAFSDNRKLPPLGIWKIIHTNVKPIGQIVMIEAYAHGVNLLDEFSELEGYSLIAYGLIAYLAKKNINTCSLLTKGMSYETFAERVKSVYGSDIVSGFSVRRFD